jgi:hypothetical protein
VEKDFSAREIMRSGAMMRGGAFSIATRHRQTTRSATTCGSAPI